MLSSSIREEHRIYNVGLCRVYQWLDNRSMQSRVRELRQLRFLGTWGLIPANGLVDRCKWANALTRLMWTCVQRAFWKTRWQRSCMPRTSAGCILAVTQFNEENRFNACRWSSISVFSAPRFVVRISFMEGLRIAHSRWTVTTSWWSSNNWLSEWWDKNSVYDLTLQFPGRSSYP